MRAIDIATEYYSKTIKCSEDIFIVELFYSIGKIDKFSFYKS